MPKPKYSASIYFDLFTGCFSQVHLQFLSAVSAVTVSTSQCFMLNLHRLCCFSRLFLFLLSLTVYLKERLHDHCSCTLYFPVKPIVPDPRPSPHSRKPGTRKLGNSPSWSSKAQELTVTVEEELFFSSSRRRHQTVEEEHRNQKLGPHR